MVSAFIARRYRASNPEERKALRDQKRRRNGKDRAKIVASLKLRLKQVILPGADGKMKSLAVFTAADVAMWYERAVNEEKGWAARRLWFEKTTAAFQEYGVRSVDELPDEVQADLGEAAGEVW